MKTPLPSMVSAALAALLSPLVAQLPTSGELRHKPLVPPFVTEIHTQKDDPEGGAYGIWAAGEDYKVSFHDGATFIPYLGSDYPQSQSFRWSTTSVTVGDQELVTRALPTGRQASDTRYEYDHGGVIEAYDVLLEGLEQTFVIPTAPAGGKLVVRGTVETALTSPPVTDRHTSLSFADQRGDPILSYGATTAVDATGRRIPMTTTYDGGSFALELDAASLRDAIYPLVVDPLIGNSFPLNTSSSAPGELDILREDGRATENVWISYTRHVSATDQDLWVMRTIDDLSGPLFLQAFVDITASWGIESCALAHTASRVICAFVRDYGTTRNVCWHAHHVDDLAKRTGVEFFTASTNNWRVDIGGNRANSASKRAMVVFQHEQGATFANGTDSSTHFFFIDMSAATTQSAQGSAVDAKTCCTTFMRDFERPRINQVADGSATGNSWCVVQPYYDEISPTPAWEVRIGIWNEDGTHRFSTLIESGNGEHKLGTIVAGSGGRYLVTWAGEDAASSGKVTGVAGHSLNSQRFFHGGVFGIQASHASYRYLTSSGANLRTHDIAYDTNTQSHWLVVYDQGNRLLADEFGYRGERLGVFNDVYKTGTSFQGACSFDADNDSYVILGSAVEAGNPLFGNVWDHNPIPPPSLSGVGCSSADLTWSQQFLTQHGQRIGHEFSGALVTGVPAGAAASLGISLSPANIPLNIAGVAPGCSLLVGNPSVFLPGVGSFFGTAWWGIPLNENLPPVTFHLQAFHLNASGSAFVSTQRLSVPIGH